MRFEKLFWCTFCMCVAGWATLANGALTQGEIDALSGLIGAFPNLGSIPTSEITRDDGNDYGRSWTNLFTDYCLNGDGYEHYGLYCESGHISGVVLTQAWTPGVQTDFSFLSGLTFLRNVTHVMEVNTATSAPLRSLVLALANLPLEHFRCTDNSIVFATGEIAPSAMKNMSVAVTTSFNLDLFDNLLHLRLNVPYLAKISDLGIWPTSLEWVELISEGTEISGVEELARNLTSLRSLQVKTQLDLLAQGQGSVRFNSDLLEFLHLTIQPINIDFTVIVNSTSLKSASFYIGPYSLALETPNLRILTLGSLAFPDGFTTLTRLEELTLIPETEYAAFPDLSYGPNLTHLSFSGWSVSQDLLHEVLCNASYNNLKLSSLTLRGTKSLPVEGLALELPACLRGAPQLRKIELVGYTSTIFNTSSVLAALPRTIEDLSIRSALSSDININDILEFTQLKNLHIEDLFLVGEMQNNFFLNFPKLDSIFLYSQTLNGTVPSVGWTNLSYVTLWCAHNIWSGLDSAPSLKYLWIFSDALESLPDDSQLDKLHKLETLLIHTSIDVPIPTPSFWTKLPSIQSVNFVTCNFSGPMSSLAAPRATGIGVTAFSICGALPDIDIPMSLNALSLSGNRFLGSIPQSWVSNLVIRTSIDLSSNMLSGTIPSNFLARPSADLVYVSFQDNYFSGPLWNISMNYPTLSLFLSDNNFDICDPNVQLPINATINTCSFGNLPLCPSDVPGCEADWAGCISMTCQNSSIRTLPPIPECPQVPSAPTPIIECPPPRPPGFECINGQYISNGSVTIPSITLPPNGGVILVIGNLSVNGSLTFDGIGTSIVVEGCVETLPTEVIIIIKGDENLKTTNLLTQKGAQCSSDLRSIPVSLIQPKNNCKQVKSSTKDSTRSSLIVVFDLDSHKCNTKWIILGSVLGGVIILFAAGITILYSLSSRFRAFIRSCKLKKG